MLTTVRRVALSQPVRAYAQAAAEPKKAPKMRAPTSVLGKAGKFAMRFFEEAYEREGDAGVRRLEQELAVLAWNVRDDTAWRVETTSAFFDKEWKRELLTKRLSKQGVSPLLVDLVLQLVEDGEVRRLQQVRVDYEELMRAYRKEVDVALTSASQLSAAQLDVVKRTIQNEYLKPDDNLIFAYAVDEALGGGYKVRIRGQEHDFSHARDMQAARDQEVRSKQIAVDQTRAKLPHGTLPSPVALIDELRADKAALGKGFVSADLLAKSRQELVNEAKARQDAKSAAKARSGADRAATLRAATKKLKVAQL